MFYNVLSDREQIPVFTTVTQFNTLRAEKLPAFFTTKASAFCQPAANSPLSAPSSPALAKPMMMPASSTPEYD
jgi:hypothetical protein